MGSSKAAEKLEDSQSIIFLTFEHSYETPTKATNLCLMIYYNFERLANMYESRHFRVEEMNCKVG